MSEQARITVAPHSELAEIVYGSSECRPLLDQQLSSRGFVDIWFGEYFLDDPEAETKEQLIVEKIDQILASINPDLPIIIEGQNRLLLHGAIELPSLDGAGRAVVNASSEDFDIEGDESGDSHVTATMRRGKYEYTIRAEGDFWTERTWKIEDYEEPVEESRFTIEQLEEVNASDNDPLDAEIDYKLAFVLRIETNQ